LEFIIGLIYTIFFISIAYSLAQIATHLKAISESLVEVKFQLSFIKENLRKEQLKKILAEMGEKKRE
jgi:hypothetical protein